jgi:aminopeptidase N
MPARDALAPAVGSALADDLAAAQAQTAPGDDLSPAAKGVRRLRGVALGCSPRRSGARRGAGQGAIDAADNMTDRQGALAC